MYTKMATAAERTPLVPSDDAGLAVDEMKRNYLPQDSFRMMLPMSFDDAFADYDAKGIAISQVLAFFDILNYFDPNQACTKFETVGPFFISISHAISAFNSIELGFSFPLFFYILGLALLFSIVLSCVMPI